MNVITLIIYREEDTWNEYGSNCEIEYFTSKLEFANYYGNFLFKNRVNDYETTILINGKDPQIGCYDDQGKDLVTEEERSFWEEVVDLAWRTRKEMIAVEEENKKKKKELEKKQREAAKIKRQQKKEEIERLEYERLRKKFENVKT